MNYNNPPPNTTIASRLAAKKQELASLTELLRHSSALVSDLQRLAANLDTLSEGTGAVAGVMQNWNNVMRAVALAALNLSSLEREDYEQGRGGKEGDVEGDEDIKSVLPETLVRMNIEKE